MHLDCTNWAALARAAQLVEEGGVEHLVGRAFHKIASPALTMGRLIFFRRDVQYVRPPLNSIPGVSMRFASIDDAPVLGRHEPLVVQVMRRRLERGDLCCMAIEDATGALAHHRWVARQPTYIPELERWFAPGPSESYFYDLLTVSAYRGLGIDRQSRALVYERLAQSGITAAYCYVRADNPAGLHVARNWHEEIGRVWYMRVRGLPPLIVGSGKIAHMRRGYAAGSTSAATEPRL